tara:strand:- start:920 stop:1291 length:372 start_codon:yes stop_codon:yes gene_type:complete
MDRIKKNISYIYASYFIFLALAWYLYGTGMEKIALYIIVCIVSLHFILGGLIAMGDPMSALKERYMNKFGVITIPTDILLIFPLVYFGQWMLNKADVSVTKKALLAAAVGNTGCLMAHILKTR